MRDILVNKMAPDKSTAFLTRPGGQIRAGTSVWNYDDRSFRCPGLLSLRRDHVPSEVLAVIPLSHNDAYLVAPQPSGCGLAVRR